MSLFEFVFHMLHGRAIRRALIAARARALKVN